MHAKKHSDLPARLSTLFFNLLYHPWAGSYDLVAGLVSLGRWKDWVLAVQPHLGGPHLLELGHGPGHLQQALQIPGWIVCGLDESRQMGRLALRRLNQAGRPARLVRGRAESLPFSAAFDTVTATFPSAYILRRESLEEVKRVLKPDGQLVVLLSAWLLGGSPAEKAARFLFRVTGEAEPIDADLADRLSRPFRQAGFRVELLMPVVRRTRLLILVARRK